MLVLGLASLQVAVVAPAVAFEPCLHHEAVSESRGMCWGQSAPRQPSAVASVPSELALHSDRPVAALLEPLG